MSVLLIYQIVVQLLVYRCSIFYASSLGTGGDAVKLPLVLRDKQMTDCCVEPTVIFDYESWFLPALNHYALSNGPVPDPRVYLLIGSQRKLSDIDKSVPIYATVVCQRAVRDLNNVSALLQVDTPVQVDSLVQVDYKVCCHTRRLVQVNCLFCQTAS